ncbi:hypothetical protein SAMN05443252_10497 [Bacillus sp. OV322]|uniref:hypothetical protein n=1 Tax=Bacillus sp. OV322 TaxID=1882764 RepID=UPI0008E25637|nr:hypothetical protein [Bacillus sp. OV322]SFC52407.1 hypothetical protein SAMN05443252_10497 [Bacillus sp. OV322]
MPPQKLTIVPVTLHIKKENILTANAATLSPDPVCTVKAAGIEVSFFHGVGEHIYF